jgi:hypothetical protein
VIEIVCGRCQKDFEVPATDEQLKRWRGGELIQRAMPNLTADERELLISGYCGRCFDEITRDPDDEDSALFGVIR